MRRRQTGEIDRKRERDRDRQKETERQSERKIIWARMNVIV